jgi:hypothetical protein
MPATDIDTLDFAALADEAESVELPSVIRNSAGREPIKWEDKLAPLTARQGDTFLTYSYKSDSTSDDDRKKAKGRATSRKQAIQVRLFEAVPGQKWTIAVRETAKGSNVFGVYIGYHGEYTAAEQAENAKKHNERSTAIKARMAAQHAAADQANAVADAAVSPAERVAQTVAQRKAS